MPLSSLFANQRPDAFSGVAEAGAGFAKTVHDYSPADPRLGNFLKRVYAGEDPRAVAIEAKFAMSRHQPPQNLPDDGMQMEPYPETPPAEASGMRGSMRSSMGSPSPGNFTGPREFSSEETVMAPSAPPSPRGSMPLPSEPSAGGEFYSQAQPPILNKDLPMLMQGAGLVQKDNKNDLGYLNYLLGRDRLSNNQNQFGRMEVHRGIRDEATQANTAEIPVRRQQANERLGISRFNAQTGAGNLAERQNQNYYKNTKDTATTIAQIDGLLGQLKTRPDIAPPSGDYRVRKEADILDSIYGGRPLAGTMRLVADAELTPDQRIVRRQARAIVMAYQHAMVGSQITGPEMELVNMIAGQQLSIDDTAAGLGALRQYMGALHKRAKYASPEAAGRIPDVNPAEVTPQFSPPPYPIMGNEMPTSLPQLPEGPSLEEEKRNSIIYQGGR